MVDFNINEIKRIIELYKINPPKRLNYLKLANYMGLRTSDRRFTRITKYLLSKRILVVLEKLGSNKILKLDKEKLKEEIPEIDFIKYLHNECIHKIYKKTIWVYNE